MCGANVQKCPARNVWSGVLKTQTWNGKEAPNKTPKPTNLPGTISLQRRWRGCWRGGRGRRLRCQRGAALGRSFRRVAARPARLLAHVAQIQMPTSKRASRSTSASFQPPQARSGPHSCTPRVSALKSVRSRRLAKLRILFLVHLHRFIALI